MRGPKFVQLVVPDDEFAGVTIATNGLINSLNVTIADLSAGADNSTQAANLLVMADHIDVIRTELGSLGMTGQTISGDQMRTIQMDMHTTGVPQWETDFLTNAGFGEAFKAKFLQRHLDADLSTIESLSAGQALVNARNSLVDRAVTLVTP